MRCPNCQNPTLHSVCQVYASITLTDGYEPEPLSAKAGAHDAVDFFAYISCEACGLVMDSEGVVMIDDKFVLDRFDRQTLDDLYAYGLKGAKALAAVEFAAERVHAPAPSHR